MRKYTVKTEIESGPGMKKVMESKGVPDMKVSDTRTAHRRFAQPGDTITHKTTRER